MKDYHSVSTYASARTGLRVTSDAATNNFKQRHYPSPAVARQHYNVKINFSVRELFFGRFND
jgi:hypothetical protein